MCFTCGTPKSGNGTPNIVDGDSRVLGSVVQSIFSLTSSLVVKMLTVLVSTIYISQVFFAEKMCVAFANAKATHICSAKLLAYMPYLMMKVLTIR